MLAGLYNWFMRQIEGVETRVAVDSLGEADAVVVLGGMVEQVLLATKKWTP